MSIYYGQSVECDEIAPIMFVLKIISLISPKWSIYTNELFVAMITTRWPDASASLSMTVVSHGDFLLNNVDPL